MVHVMSNKVRGSWIASGSLFVTRRETQDRAREAANSQCCGGSVPWELQRMMWLWSFAVRTRLPSICALGSIPDISPIIIL